MSAPPRLTPAYLIRQLIFLSLGLLVILSLAVIYGESNLSWSHILHRINPDHAILWQVRLPRVLLGALVGFALSSGGVAFQNLLRNPLADPYILGVSGGAALGSVLAITFGLHFSWVSLLAFLGAFLSLILIYAIAQDRGRLPVMNLLLTGVIFNSFCFALIMFLNTLVPSTESHRIWYLLVGSLERESYEKIAIVAFFVFSGFTLLCYYAPAMNLMATGELSAQSLGLDVQRFRKLIFFAASWMIGATVSVSGLIGLVGLFVPHLVRLRWGADHRLLLPASGIFGAGFLVLADWLARVLLSGEQFQTQFPVGVITAFIGTPCFIYLLKRRSAQKL